MISNQIKIPPIQELFYVNKLPLKIHFDFSPQPIKIWAQGWYLNVSHFSAVQASCMVDTGHVETQISFSIFLNCDNFVQNILIETLFYVIGCTNVINQ